ncbi:hypothetical protein Tco_0418998 [Tanacetum coccineum]
MLNKNDRQGQKKKKDAQVKMLAREKAKTTAREMIVKMNIENSKDVTFNKTINPLKLWRQNLLLLKIRVALVQEQTVPGKD